MAIIDILLIFLGQLKVQFRAEEYHNEFQHDNDGIFHDIFCTEATISSTEEVIE